MVFRSYFSRWVSDGLRHLRPAILGPGPDHPGDIVGRYQAALDVGDTEAVVSTFASDGYYREPIGPPYVHREPSELREFFSGCFSGAGFAIFERGPDDLLAAVRVYDDVQAPAEQEPASV